MLTSYATEPSCCVVQAIMSGGHAAMSSASIVNVALCDVLRIVTAGSTQVELLTEHDPLAQTLSTPHGEPVGSPPGGGAVHC